MDRPIRTSAVRAKPSRLVAGLMTGTSMDGLDIAICRLPARAPEKLELVATGSADYPDHLREALLAQGALTVGRAARLGRELGLWYADELAGLAARRDLAIDLVGMHGQTVHHEHGVASVQLGQPAFLAARLGCPVVADFRANDIAVGGCGAPLVPIVDLWLLGRGREAVLSLNLGGIANVTAIQPDASGHVRIQGFDCGPANMVLDELARRFSGGEECFDRDGRLALTGEVRPDWLDFGLREPFFARSPPRSAGREDFGAAFVDRLVRHAAPVSPRDRADLMATAVALAAQAIRSSIERFVAPLPSFVGLVAAGGGTRNPALMAALHRALAPLPVSTLEAFGVPSQFKEAIAFAMLANARIDEIPTNLPDVTGATRPALLGQIVEV